MEWVGQCLGDISEETFNEASVFFKKENESVANLESSLAKYTEKLKKVEEKLVKGYQEVKSKRRYM